MHRKVPPERVIAAILAAPTKAEAARMLGVSARTIHNYCADPAFAERLEVAREDDARRFEEIRRSAVGTAIRTLADVMTSDDSVLSTVTARDRVEAARTVLRYAESIRPRDAPE